MSEFCTGRSGSAGSQPKHRRARWSNTPRASLRCILVHLLTPCVGDRTGAIAGIQEHGIAADGGTMAARPATEAAASRRDSREGAIRGPTLGRASERAESGGRRRVRRAPSLSEASMPGDAPSVRQRPMKARSAPSHRYRGTAQVRELLSCEIAAEQPEAAIGGGDDARRNDRRSQ